MCHEPLRMLWLPFKALASGVLRARLSRCPRGGALMDDREGRLHVVPLRREGGLRGEGSPEIVATYREIADHFGLKGPDQGRTKAKRAAWPAEPQNHPADPLRIRVPREAWEGAAQARERGLSLRSERGTARKVPSPPQRREPHPTHEPQALTP